MGQGAVRSQTNTRIAFPVQEQKTWPLVLRQGVLKAGCHANKLNAPGKFLVSSPRTTPPPRPRLTYHRPRRDRRRRPLRARTSATRPHLPDRARSKPPVSPARKAPSDAGYNGIPSPKTRHTAPKPSRRPSCAPGRDHHPGNRRHHRHAPALDLLPANRTGRIRQGSPDRSRPLAHHTARRPAMTPENVHAHAHA